MFRRLLGVFGALWFVNLIYVLFLSLDHAILLDSNEETHLLPPFRNTAVDPYDHHPNCGKAVNAFVSQPFIETSALHTMRMELFGSSWFDESKRAMGSRLSVKLGLFRILGSSVLVSWSRIPGMIYVSSWTTTPVSAVLNSSSTTLPSMDQLNDSLLIGVDNSSSKDDEDFSERNHSETAWCILDHDNLSRFYRHFPHTLESLAPCWSYFSRHNDKKCGFFLNSTRIDWSQVRSWSSELIEAMGCTFVKEQPEHFEEYLVLAAAAFLLVNNTDLTQLTAQKLFYDVVSSDDVQPTKVLLTVNSSTKEETPQPLVATTVPLDKNNKAPPEKKPDPPVCTESRSSNFTRFTYAPSARLSNFLEGPGLNDDGDNATAAVCEFNHEIGSNWFPHFMQQLYRCWSYWCLNVPLTIDNIDTKEQGKKEPVLVYNPKIARGRKSSFYDGILAAFKEAANVKIVASADSYNNTVSTKLAPNGRIRDYAMLPGHSQILTHVIAQHYSLDSAKAGCPKQNNNNTFPRIAILNRKGSRRLLNVDTIAMRLQALLPPNTTVPIVYFEGMSFLDQVQFFRDTDLVVAPHGASLTGVAFLPRCGYVMEVFPFGYDIPGLFGSLAVNSGHQHGYIKLTNTGEFRREHAEAMKNKRSRDRARAARLCPPVDKIVDAVSKMIREWRKCCNEKQSAAASL